MTVRGSDEGGENMAETGKTGALGEFMALFENPRQAKQSDGWRRYFLSEAFLGEQFSEEFARGLSDYLRGQGTCPWDNLPMGLLMELAIAYGLVPRFERAEYFEGLKYPKEWYKVSTERGELFPAIDYVAEIFNIQGRECDLKSMTRRMMNQPGNKVRHNAFSDYLALREMSRRGLLEGDGEVWQSILNKCRVHYLYERNGKRPGQGDYESRSECVVKLYVQWLKDERLPEQVLKFFYKKLDFKDLDRSSTRGLYGALKEQVVRQMPDVEELLFGEDGKEQAIVKVYRVCAGIINDHQTNHDKSVYEETKEIGRRVEELSAMPQWDLLKGDGTFFERLFFVAKRLVMPPSLARWLIGYLWEGDFPEPKRTELVESLLRSLSTERSCREMDHVCEVDFGDRDLGELEPGEMEASEDFWQYYLMRGFGYRHRKLRGQWEADYIYEAEGYCYLPAYISYLYDPSRAWQRRFTRFDEEREQILRPVRRECQLPDGRRLTVEFHYHYCLYFVDGAPVTAPVIRFEELKAADVRPLEFFFLLAVTAIAVRERPEAEALIETWLRRIPIYPQICPLIARLLAGDNDRLPEGVREVYYMEQERFCFRAVVGEPGIRVFRQVDFGWQDIPYRRSEFGWKWVDLPPDLAKRAEAFLTGTERTAGETAREILEGLRQPLPTCREVRTVAHMDVAEKTAAILETMGYFEKEESYCVLRYGERRERRHDRLFYGAKVPFGFSVRAQSGAHERWVDYLTSTCGTKIKEGKRLAARFGWGFKYSHESDFWPICVYVGDSGTYYAYGAVKLHRAESLVELLADVLRTEFLGVTEAAAYEGCLTVSRFDHRLEYCYGEEDWLGSVRGEEKGQADLFTVFGRHRLWTEFSRWLDDCLGEGLPFWVNVAVLGLDPDFGGSLTFRGIHVEEEPVEPEGGREDFWEFCDAEDGEAKRERPGEDGTSGRSRRGREEYGVYCPDVPVLVWEKGLDLAGRMESLREAVGWYEGRKGESRVRIVVE